jgi:nickel-dependent lactate racemase
MTVVKWQLHLFIPAFAVYRVSSIFRYGAGASIRLEFADGALLAECGTPSVVPADDPSKAVAQALDEPIDYPPLTRTATPGDRVVVALDEGLPQASQIVAAVIHALLRAGVDPDGITVLQTAEDSRSCIADPGPGIPADARQRIRLLVHEPSDRGSLAYLAATKNGEPIHLNRALADADVLLPIGCVRRRGQQGFRGVHSPIFPAYSDQRTQLRFRTVDALGSAADRKGLVQEVANVGWLLGVSFTIQVVPGPGARVLHVLAGHVDAVRRRSRELYEAAWRFTAPRRASLVVASIEGGTAQQTWQNVGRALGCAERLVEEGGAIALCCELAGEPGPAVRRLATATSRGEALRHIRHERAADLLPALQLARSVGRCHVYLLSRLDRALLEDLQISPLQDSTELARLARRHATCILLANAPWAVVAVAQNE